MRRLLTNFTLDFKDVARNRLCCKAFGRAVVAVRPGVIVCPMPCVARAPNRLDNLVERPRRACGHDEPDLSALARWWPEGAMIRNFLGSRGLRSPAQTCLAVAT